MQLSEVDSELGGCTNAGLDSRKSDGNYRCDDHFEKGPPTAGKQEELVQLFKK